MLTPPLKPTKSMTGALASSARRAAAELRGPTWPRCQQTHAAGGAVPASGDARAVREVDADAPATVGIPAFAWNFAAHAGSRSARHGTGAVVQAGLARGARPAGTGRAAGGAPGLTRPPVTDQVLPGPLTAVDRVGAGLVPAPAAAALWLAGPAPLADPGAAV